MLIMLECLDALIKCAHAMLSVVDADAESNASDVYVSG
jgi:hypothetical protein